MQIQSPDDLRKLIDILIEKLEARQQQDAADRLRGLQGAVFTTSSEWLGEIGQAVRFIQKEVRVDKEIRQILDQIMQIVKKAWPHL